ICPAKNKALVMKPLEEVKDDIANWEFGVKLPIAKDVADAKNVKSSQFLQPLFEFSGACAGCGETPYIKLASQLFGERMMIANATGCTSIYGGSAPTCPYSQNEEGHGPAWANSLFEDNAEFGFGMNIALAQRRAALKDNIEAAMDAAPAELKAAFEKWVANSDDADVTKECKAEIMAALPAAIAAASGEQKALLEKINADSDLIIKKSLWIIGGDGWAYDIGYGGLDHVIAQGEDVNILVLDTEVYSNTGGQASKATPTGSVAKFAAAGKRVKKKDLGAIAMQYGYVYVASCAMGADHSQVLKAMKEAEAYKGPSLIICYAPCINHGINMSQSQNEQKKAVQAGYWPLYRYNPDLKEEGKNPFILDSKAPSADYIDFILGETRYRTLKQLFPETAEKLFDKAAKEATERYDHYASLAGKE
ncbi:MAG: thiamine pyrophosphate-dependent enzyme, partial [Christensenellaceae bacterium]